VVNKVDHYRRMMKISDVPITSKIYCSQDYSTRPDGSDVSRYKLPLLRAGSGSGPKAAAYIY